MDSNAVKRRLTCILAADAVGYSKLMSEDEENALRVLAAHRAVIDGVIAFHNGRIVNTAGDSVLAEFASAVEAVRCAVEVQDALRTRNESLPVERRMLFRVGVNLGDVVVKGTDLLGDGVNIAARLESIAEPGGIVISSGIYDQITGKLDLGFQDIGEQNLKNITHPVRAFRVSGSGGTVRLPNPARRSRGWMPWTGAALVLVVAGALAVGKMGWFASPTQPPAPTSAAADPERVRLQAELAAAEKARQEAESRASNADAAAVRAKAENEATALRTKAQAEAASVKAKAESEAAAVRSRSEIEAKAVTDKAKAAGDASAAKATAEATAAREKTEAAAPRAAEPAKTAALSPPAPKFDPSIYDGGWTATLTCDNFEDLTAGSRQIPVTATGGVFTMDWGEQGSPGGGHAQGRPSGDGSLTLRGTSIARNKRSAGKSIGVRFDGTATGQKFELQGHIGLRNCTVSLARAAAH